MMDNEFQGSLQQQWETSRTPTPLDFPSLVLGKIAQAMMAAPGSKERHRHLRDVQSLLAPYHDSDFHSDMDEAAVKRDGILNGKEPGVTKGEAEEMHQLLWVEALMRMMKRRGFLGEEWVRG